MLRASRVVLAACCGVLVLAGCETEIEPERPRAPAPAAAPAPSSTLPSRGAGSSLGKAKESAENVVNQLEDRDRELQRQLEGDG